MKSGFTVIEAVVGVAIVALIVVFLWALLGNQNMKQNISHMKSGLIGLKREVTLYANDGTVIKQWEGRYKVETTDGVARFIHDGNAVTINGTYIIEEVD